MNTKIISKSLLVAFVYVSMTSSAMCQFRKAKIGYKSFSICAINKRITLDWVIDAKDSANYFEIQRSIDGKNFTTVALVLGPDPKESAGDTYEGFDEPIKNSKKYFYRLKHVASDGATELSQTRLLAIN